jgi:aspartokinase/homoserine dehydrogenase 1
MSWVVHKFGGTSVANLERYRAVAEIVRKEPGEKKAIVVSAMAKVTDALHDVVERARLRDDTYAARLSELEAKHLEVATSLADPDLSARIKADVRDLADVLRAVWLGRSSPEATLELVVGYGEVWSAQILRAVLGAEASWIDAREVLIVAAAEMGVAIDWELSKEKLRAALATRPEPLVVITGYVASTKEGVPATLKRNGSDYSASIFGSLLDAEAISIWTDVDGVLSADPRRVPEAILLEEMSYAEAIELAYFGAKVVHPQTMAPAVEKNIPIWIRNTFAPNLRGTRIGPGEAPSEKTPVVKGFSTIDGVALVNLEGTGMIGVPGVAQRLFGALREVNVSVIMISQASSEHSICFAVLEKSASLAKSTVERAFAEELRTRQIETVEVTAGCSILAAVGDGMVHTPGVAARLFNALSRAGINIRAIAQGSSERNISIVIDRTGSTRALRAVHAGLFLSDQTISVGIVGPGLVGATLLKQLAAQLHTLRSELHIDLRVRAIMNSKKMFLGEPSIDLHDWEARLNNTGGAIDVAAFVAHVRAEHLPHAVIVDASASEEVADCYQRWLEDGIHVITPNKRAGAGALERYQAIKKGARGKSAHFFYEATVGAGLPVISTLRDLILTGDRVRKIEGILSGTASYLFAELAAKQRFSDLVRSAKEKGYTEPDPRDDLSGTDVARKLVILAREIGVKLELSQVQIESLVPAGLDRAMTPEEFLDKLKNFDDTMEGRRIDADRANCVLRYVGTVDAHGVARVELLRYPASHPFSKVAAGDNIIAFTTDRYSTHPLIVQGPGAGPEVTAGGVFADLLRLAAHLGART